MKKCIVISSYYCYNIFVKGGNRMKDSPLINKSKSFALEVLNVCKELRATKCEGVFSSRNLV